MYSNTINKKRLNKILGNTNINSNNTVSTSSSDCNIYSIPSNQLNLTNYLYDNQTILYVNSSTNSNLNTSKGMYIDPNNTSWSFQNNNQNAVYAGSSFQSSLINSNQYKNSYSLDLTNGTQSTTNSNPLFFGIGVNYTNTVIPTLTSPNYNTSGTSNYLVQSQYLFQQESNILVVKLVASVNNTDSLNVTSITTNQPVINLEIINQVIPKDDIQNGILNAKNIYKKTAILNYGNFKSADQSTNNLYNSVPFIFAPGCKNEWMNISVLYVPPILDNGLYYGQYLPQSGFVFNNGSINFDTSQLVQTTDTTDFGHFVFGIGYNMQNSSYSTYLINGIQCDLLIKNIWRSPISIFNSYEKFSVSQMTLISVVLLFGTNVNGSLFLALNTGTPISSLTHYGVTSLANFMNIMRAFKIEYDDNEQLVDYFINQFTINSLKNKGYDVLIVQQHALVDTNTISNPSTVNSNPNMTYFLLHDQNSVNIKIDTTEQNILNDISSLNPFNLSNTNYCSLGDLFYSCGNVKTLKTNNNTVFPDSLNLGYETIDNKIYNINIILPESLFRPCYEVNDYIAQIYSSPSSVYYFVNYPFAIRFDKNDQNPNQNNRVSLVVSNNVIF